MTIEEVPPITAIQRVEELIGYLAHIVKEDKVALDDMIANAPSTLRDDATEEQLEEKRENRQLIPKQKVLNSIAVIRRSTRLNKTSLIPAFN